MTFYPREVTSQSRILHDDLQGRFRDAEVTLIGGWAVAALTSPEYQEESRDLDLVFHDRSAFSWFRSTFMRRHGLVWSGGRRKYNSCYRPEDPRPRQILVDVFASDPSVLDTRFAVEPKFLFKTLENRGWLPTTPALLRDKLATLPLRGKQDAAQKRFKDAIDAWALIHHNVTGDLPGDLRDVVPNHLVRGVASKREELQDYAEEAGIYEDELQEFLDWL